MERDSCDCFQMRASAFPAGWAGCGELHAGNQNPDQMCHVSVNTAHIWLRATQQAPGQAPIIPSKQDSAVLSTTGGMARQGLSLPGQELASQPVPSAGGDTGP